MKAVITALVLAAGVSGAPAFAADVGVSIGFGQPGVYGRVDVGRFPQPVLVQPRPVIVGRPVVAYPQPVYLWVPPGHRQHWQSHCARYNACGVPVYFVQDRWYNEHVMPARRHDLREDHRHDRREDRRDDRHDDHRHH